MFKLLVGMLAILKNGCIVRTMIPQNSRATPERSRDSLKKEGGPVRVLADSNESLVQGSQFSPTEPDFAEEVHNRAETVTSLLANILARPTPLRHSGINE